MNIIDLFSGAGGLTEGFLKNGYNFVAHVEKEYWACETLKTRLLYYHLIKNNDIRTYNEYLKNSTHYKRINDFRKIIYDKYPHLEEEIDREVLNLTFGNPKENKSFVTSKDVISLIQKNMTLSNIDNIDLIIGGPPCQAYSLAGRARMKDKVVTDNRNFLFEYYLDIVNHFKPKAFVFENVPGLLTALKGEIFLEIIKKFNDIGYTVLTGNSEDHKKNIINSSNHGIPQNRKRLILFGFKKDLKYNYPDFTRYSYRFSSLSTKSAISDLTPMKHNSGDDFILTKYTRNNDLTEYQKLMRKDSIGIINHKSRKNRISDLEIYKKVIENASKGKKFKYTDLDKNDQTHSNLTSFLDRFKTHWWNDIPHTIVAHIAKDGHYNIHPDINQLRSLTVREAARIQSFPDTFKFEGPRTSQYTQVGNAVPPLLSDIIAKAIKDIL
jgi:DNA (cytosine-5)-methyltransferase 1